MVLKTSILCFIVGLIGFFLRFQKLKILFCLTGWGKLFSLNFFIDFIRLQFFRVLMVIVGRVLIFSLFYMADEVVRFKGFIWVVFLFVLSMVFLIFRGDWLILILGWDWLGVRSFFLVAFYKRDSSWSGRLKTYLTKRFGDGFFLFVLRVFIFEFGFLNIIRCRFVRLVIVLLTQTKSAQMPFRAWLPAAMAAPTPVSALVHSSTLVTAGIFILIRLISVLKIWSYYICFIGLITLFIGRISACGRMDMKKVVAFSTLSHLGFMVVCLASGVSLLAFFHLVVHASFKALLFLCVGSLIVINNHSQDLRQIRFNWENVFFIWGALISVIRLCGFPYFSGFFSKDFIIEYYFWNVNWIFFFLFLSSLVLTVVYRGRLIRRFIKIKWVVRRLVVKNFYFLYFIPLLFFSVILGMVRRQYCVSFFLVGGTRLLKIVIYVLLTSGLIVLLKKNLFSFMRSSISFLDSLGPGVVLINRSFRSFHQSLDLGFLPRIRESGYDWCRSNITDVFWNKLGDNLFLYIFLFGLIFMVF